MRLAMKVQRLRATRGLTQAALAKKSKLHLVTVGKIEAGMVKNPDLLTRKKLAKALGVPITDLLD